MKHKTTIWKVYGEVPYKLWQQFREKCDIETIDSIIIKALEEEIRKAGD